ncbi:MAG: HlyD family secretion protein [Clostridiales bacterium]|nr:HlyD family secretion protein [Clostridiales bacterium]
MFDKEPPAFGYFLIWIIGGFLCATLVWSIRTPKVYTIEAQGTVTSEESNYVMCSYTGEIDECDMAEGMIVEEGDTLFTVKTTDYDVQIEQLELSREVYETQVSQYELLVQSIKDDTNYFDVSNLDDELYYSTYETYKAQVEQKTLDTSTYSSYGYTDEQIEAQLETNQSAITEIYYTAIQSAESAIEEAETQIASIDAQISALQSGQEEYTVKATASGVLHLLGSYKSGMVLQTTTTVATITPENSEPVIEAYVSTSDMARMHEGDTVQIVIDGLAQNVYGSISGTIKQIDSNVTTQESEDGSTTQAFRVLVEMDSDYLVSKSGDKVDITNGMTAVARVQYDKVTYFNYVLEKLGFRTK